MFLFVSLVGGSLAVFLIYKEFFVYRQMKKELSLWRKGWQIKNLAEAQMPGSADYYVYKLPADREWKSLNRAYRESGRLSVPEKNSLNSEDLLTII